MIKINTTRPDESKPSEYLVSATLKSKQVGSIPIRIISNISIDRELARIGVIERVEVDPRHRMQGIAQMMLKEAMAKFAKEKVDIAVIDLGVSEAPKLYLSVGFVSNEQTKQMYAAVENKTIFDRAMQMKNKINLLA